MKTSSSCSKSCFLLLCLVSHEQAQEDESQWDYMVKKDERTAAVWDLMRRFIERDFLDLTERHHPPTVSGDVAALR